MFVEEADEIRVRLRSKGPIINPLAKKYNGGGHPLASGATVLFMGRSGPSNCGFTRTL